MIRILHTADLHLDNGFTASNLPYEIIKDRQRDLLTTFDRIIELARKERVDILLISGDLFEHRYIKLNTIHYVNKRLGELNNTKIFILPGNHDPYNVVHFYRTYPWNKNIHIFKDRYEKVPIRKLNLIVHGIGYGYQEESRPLLEQLIIPPTGEINILMLHGTDTTSSPQKQSKYLPFNYEDLLKSGFDYIALGHFHNYKIYKDLYGKIIGAYPGSPEPLGFDELGNHGIILGEISREKNNIDILPLSKRQYYKLDIDITGANGWEEIKITLLEKITPLNPKDNLFKIRLYGSFSWELGETIEFFQNQLKDLAYYIHIQDDTAPEYEGEDLLYNNTLLSSYSIKLQKRLEQEKDERQRKILKKAMTIGANVLRGGKNKI